MHIWYNDKTICIYLKCIYVKMPQKIFSCVAGVAGILHIHISTYVYIAYLSITQPQKHRSCGRQWPVAQISQWCNTQIRINRYIHILHIYISIYDTSISHITI